MSHDVFDYSLTVLIETLWNVKCESGLSGLDLFVLIETLWNVNLTDGEESQGYLRF